MVGATGILERLVSLLDELLGVLLERREVVAVHELPHHLALALARLARLALALARALPPALRRGRGRSRDLLLRGPPDHDGRGLRGLRGCGRALLDRGLLARGRVARPGLVLPDRHAALQHQRLRFLHSARGGGARRPQRRSVGSLDGVHLHRLGVWAQHFWVHRLGELLVDELVLVVFHLLGPHELRLVVVYPLLAVSVKPPEKRLRPHAEGQKQGVDHRDGEHQPQVVKAVRLILQGWRQEHPRRDGEAERDRVFDHLQGVQRQLPR
mmetsp:Transcript_49598/g.138384  ORF Transcript_49598/g.138384 Transcript_49598/m.138384 type:complete len:269 (+) Transcript_49598:560-1366(+)